MSHSPEKELRLIINLIHKHPEGISIQDLLSEPSVSLSRRTLQRRLTVLLERNLIHSEGQGPGLRYFIQAAQEELPKSEELIPLSEEGEKVRSFISKPLIKRDPIGYERSFLYAYKPNEMSYLPESLRNELRESGQQPDGDHPAGTFACQIMSQLLIDLSWNSSRLEGNTYSLLETEKLLRMGEFAEGKTSFEAQMILNHKSAIEFIVKNVDRISLNPYTILNLHAILSENLLGNPKACGALRAIPVGIGGRVYHPTAIPQLIKECFSEILQKGEMIQDPLEQAFFMMVHLPYLQPFEDVNKRVSRLAANIPLIKHNLCPLSFIDLDERMYIDSMLGVYELNRIELLRDVFSWAYKRSVLRYSAIRHEVGEPDPFKLRHRSNIHKLVSDVVKGKLSKNEATKLIQSWASQHLDSKEKNRFIEVTETELLHLHLGNIARFGLFPEDFDVWQRVWK